MKQFYILKSISYEQAAELVVQGRELLSGAAAVTCQANCAVYRQQLKRNVFPSNMLWAELKAQRDTAVDFKDLLGAEDPCAVKKIDELYDNYKEAGLIDDDAAKPEVMVNGRENRSLVEVFRDCFPKTRSAASTYTRSQNYTYAT